MFVDRSMTAVESRPPNTIERAISMNASRQVSDSRLSFVYEGWTILVRISLFPLG